MSKRINSGLRKVSVDDVQVTFAGFLQVAAQARSAQDAFSLCRHIVFNRLPESYDAARK